MVSGFPGSESVVRDFGPSSFALAFGPGRQVDSQAPNPWPVISAPRFWLQDLSPSEKVDNQILNPWCEIFGPADVSPKPMGKRVPNPCHRNFQRNFLAPKIRHSTRNLNAKRRNHKTAQPHTAVSIHVYAVVLNTGGASISFVKSGTF